MSERRGTKALETWCRRLTEGYPGVKVENMTTSWRDGLAFCAIIHHFRPDLIDFNTLNKSNVYYNNSLAFQIAERQLGIPALLDAEDMVEYTVPDRLSILTYLSQFYQVFGQNSTASGTSASKQGSPARLVPKRSQDRGMISPTTASPPTKMAFRSSTGSALGRRDPCAKCGNPVFLAERLNVGTRLYHRTCFRCARCNNQLSLANYYETETDGQYCCETCPDEETSTDGGITSIRNNLQDTNSNSRENSDSLLSRLEQFRNRSLSDEDKSKGLQQFEEDEYSADFEHALEEESRSDKFRDDSMLSKARSNFLSTQMLNELENDDALVPEIKMVTDLDEPPPLPVSKPPDYPTEVFPLPESKPPDNPAEISPLPESNPPNNPAEVSPLPESKPPNYSTKVSPLPESKPPNYSTKVSPLPESKPLDNPTEVTSLATDTENKSSSIIVPESKISSATAVIVNNLELIIEEKPLVNTSEIPVSASTDQQVTASDTMLDNETTNLREKNITKDTNRSSLVKSRMLIFEAGDKTDTKSISNKDKINIVSKYFNNNNSKIDKIIENDQIATEALKEEEPVKVDDVIILDTSELTTADEDSIVCISSEADSSVNDNLNFERSKTDDGKSCYESISSEDNVEDSSYRSVRSDINISDSVIVIDSSLSETNSPLDKLSALPDSNLKKVLSESLLENLSDAQSPVSIDKSLLETSSDASKSITNPDTEKYPEDLNPFGDDDSEELQLKNVRQLIKPSMEDLAIITPEKQLKAESTNPFGSSDEEEENDVLLRQKPPRPPQPSQRTEPRKLLTAPRVSLNPFWSDGEEEEEVGKPVPKPRSKHLGTPEPRPRRSKPGLPSNGERYDSSSSLSSMSSSFSLTPGKKKKPAPPPPSQIPAGQTLTPSYLNSKQASPCTSAQQSPKTTPRARKNRKAPLPPSSTPLTPNANPPSDVNTTTYSPITDVITREVPDAISNSKESIHSPTASHGSSEIEKEKISKDEKNRNRQSQNISSPVLSDSDSLSLSQQASSATDKSSYGKWKRKKGPAPSRPVPQRRQIRPLPLAELRRELDIIEVQQQGLEKQGVKLEQLIREKCETPGALEDSSLPPDVEELVLELFELVNEKNELFRKQAELMYLRRQQRLEEEHADIEYQIRCLMERPERNKTDSDKAREEELINRLMEVVERRNEIVECLEMDRVRENEEDESIKTRLKEVATKREEESSSFSETPVKLSKKEKKKMKKEKKLKDKGKTSVDADKDIDESEVSSLRSEKEKKKKRWFSHLH